MARTMTSRTAFDGTAALAVEPRGSLVLIEGGLSARRSRRREAAPGHLTARQALAFVLAALAVSAAVALAGAVAEARVASARDAALAGAGERVVTVQPGDSLWSIAERSGAADAPAVVSWVMERNGLSGAELRVGQRLVVPGARVG